VSKNSLTAAALAHASDAVKRLNPGLFAVGALRHDKHQQNQGSPLERSQARARPSQIGPFCRVTIISVRPGVLDSDNLTHSCKGIRDAIANLLGLDDADKFITWEYGQTQTHGQQGTIVKIEEL
jgi:hypothetical protein